MLEDVINFENPKFMNKVHFFLTEALAYNFF